MSLEDTAMLLRATDLADDGGEAISTFFGVAAREGHPAIADPVPGGVDDRAVSTNEFHSRLFDMTFAVLVLVAVAPALLLLVVALQIGSPGPVLFIQQRVGRNGVLFPCFKLRTMVVDAKERLEALLESDPVARVQWETDHKLKDDPRITSLGRFARRFSLDELPQLVNIFLGHMSVVGPRPIVDEEVWRYGPFFSDYCSVRPGLTGLWQVSGRNNTTYEERVMLDRDYARAKCLAVDLRIICRTVGVVACAHGAY